MSFLLPLDIRRQAVRALDAVALTVVCHIVNLVDSLRLHHKLCHLIVNIGVEETKHALECYAFWDVIH